MRFGRRKRRGRKALLEDHDHHHHEWSEWLGRKGEDRIGNN